MAIGKPQRFDIPLEELQNVEQFTFNMLHMDRDTVMEDFDDVYERTRDKGFHTFTCEGMVKYFSVANNDGSSITLDDGTAFASSALARYLKRADEIALYAVTVHGYDVLAKDPENDMFDGMFYDAWGVGYSMGAHRWIKDRIQQRASEAGKFVGRGWTAGEGELEMGLQKALYETLDPSPIGIKMLENMLMSPIMSISGFMGISNDPEIANDGKEAIEYH